MLIPRYYFSDDYNQFHDYFLSCPHALRSFKKNDYLWTPGEPLTHVYYVEHGIAETLVEHEDDYRKILSFHGKGTVFPGCHQLVFKIENSIITKALSDMEVLSFSKDEFYQMFLDNKDLSAQVLDWYAMYINLLIYETAHQEYNNSFIKLCNLLYLFSLNSPGGKRINLTQENIADILTINRVNAAKSLSRLRDEKIIVTHRRWIEIINQEALEAYCSKETLLS